MLLRHEVGTRQPTAVLLGRPARELTDDLLLAVAFAVLGHVWRPVTSG